MRAGPNRDIKCFGFRGLGFGVIMENQMEKKMENSMDIGAMGFIRVILRLYWGYIGILEKEMEAVGIIGII